MTSEPTAATWTMPLAEFFSSYQPPTWSDEPSAWSDVLDDLNSYPPDRHIIDALRTEYRRNGRFDEAIRVTPSSEGEWVVGNGMHRLAALHAENAETVWVTADYQNDGVPVIEVHFVLSTQTGEHPTDEQMDEAFSWLRSFRLEDVWVTTDGFSSQGGVASGHWYCPLTHQHLLADALRSRLESHMSLNMKVISVEHDPDFGVLSPEDQAWWDELTSDSADEQSSPVLPPPGMP